MRTCCPLLLLAVAGCSSVSSAKRPMFALSLKKSEDRAIVLWQEGRAVLDVRSRSGIGKATVRLIKGDWPRALTVRLHLRGLEAFTARNDRAQLSASVLSHSGNRILQSVRVGGADEELPVEHPYRMDITIVDHKPPPKGKIPVGDGTIDVGLPQVLFSGRSRMIELSWVDFYR